MVLITAGGCFDLSMRSRRLDYLKQPANKDDCKGPGCRLLSTQEQLAPGHLYYVYYYYYCYYY